MRLGTRLECVGSLLRVLRAYQDGTREFARRRPRLTGRLSRVAKKLARSWEESKLNLRCQYPSPYIGGFGDRGLGLEEWLRVVVDGSKQFESGYDGRVLRLERCPKDNMVGGSKMVRVWWVERRRKIKVQ
ncbi:hypothetical protein BHE74_00003307 [Ensete ventricosum]|nr:hypothetical protein BHE74_00003307 [Ensete ventricosum]